MSDEPSREHYLRDADVCIYCGNALEVLRELQPGSIDACVTSPPYGDQRAYGGAVPSDYADWISPFFELLTPLLKPQGSVLLNLGRIFRNGEEHPYIEETLLMLRDYGWKRIDTVIWSKTNAMPMGPPYLNNRHEFVFWLAQAPQQAYRGYDEIRIPHDPETIRRYERGNLRGQKDDRAYKIRERPPLNPLGMVPPSVFECAVGADRGNTHPAPMALQLAEFLVCLSCPPGGTVLDPFAGSGTTGLAARNRGRRAVLIDHEESYCAIAAERLSQQSLFAERSE